MKKKTEQKQELPKYPIYVHRDVFTSVTRERNQDDEWDGDDLSYDSTVLGVESSKPDSYAEIAAPFEVVDGEDYYLVYATYSTGDSFHREDGRTHDIDLFKTREKAEACAKAIEEHYAMSSDSIRWSTKKIKQPPGYNEWQISYRNEAGEEQTICPAWVGYFERLQYVTVEKVQKFSSRDEGKIRYRY